MDEFSSISKYLEPIYHEIQKLNKRLEKLEKSSQKVIVTGSNLNRLPKPLNLSEEKLLNLYNYAPQILREYATPLSVTAETYQKKTNDIYLEYSINGYYWLILSEKNLQQNYWLFPNGERQINFYRLEHQIKSLFTIQGDISKQDSSFTLEKPAKIEIFPSGKKWQLIAKGKIKMRQESPAQKLLLELEKITNETAEIPATLQELLTLLKSYNQSKYQPEKEKNRAITLANISRVTQIRTLRGHQDSINSVIISCDRQSIISCSSDKSIKIWNLGTGELVDTFKGHKNSVNSLAISHDDRYIVSGSYGEIKVWNLSTQKLIYTLLGHEDWVETIAISHDDQYIVSGSYQEIKVWSLHTGELLQTLTAHQDWVNALVVSYDDSYLISGSGDQTIKVWDLQTGTLLHNFTEQGQPINSLALTHDNQYIISASKDNTIKIWDLHQRILVNTLQDYQHWISSVAINQHDQYIISGSGDRTIKFWDLHRRILLHTLRGHQKTVTCVAISNDDRYIVSGSGDRTIKIWALVN
jgi:WD40 repeat protein